MAVASSRAVIVPVARLTFDIHVYIIFTDTHAVFVQDHQSDETPRDNGKTHYLDRQDVDCGGYPLNGFQMKTGQGGSMISYKYGCLEGVRLDVSEVADVCSCGQPFFGLGAHTWINRLTCSVLFVVLFLRMAGEDDFCGR